MEAHLLLNGHKETREQNFLSRVKKRKDSQKKRLDEIWSTDKGNTPGRGSLQLARLETTFHSIIKSLFPPNPSINFGQAFFCKHSQ